MFISDERVYIIDLILSGYFCKLRSHYITIHMKVPAGNNFTQVDPCVYLSVCLSVCSDSKFDPLKPETS